jgi:hypothetical protein
MTGNLDPDPGRLNRDYFCSIQIFWLTPERAKFVNEVPSEGVCSLNNMSQRGSGGHACKRHSSPQQTAKIQ